MEVSVETTEGLQRTMTVTVPTERVEKEISSRLNRLKQTVKLNGFRPGKVPMTVIKKRFADSVRYEVAEELINSSFGEAVNQENLSPAGVPKIEPGDFSKGGDITYKAIFEVYPEVKVVDFGGITVERPSVDLSDEDVDKMVDNLREQQKGWGEVERESVDGDQVTIDFT
ncbi:MAG TPA: trigger factor, partial [Gammaproteobacteria bacterium]|nr:trigger factor [Gammaproteobacteria bacterium]